MLDSLQKRHQFLTLRDRGVKHVTRYFILQAYNTKQEQPPLYGLTASKKIGNAVTRNRARRRMRALVRLHLSDNARIGWHYGLIARFDMAHAPYQDIEAAFIEAIGVIHEKKRSQGQALSHKKPNKNNKKIRVH